MSIIKNRELFEIGAIQCLGKPLKKSTSSRDLKAIKNFITNSAKNN